MWPYEDEEAELFQFRGTSINNPMRNSGPILSLDFGQVRRPKFCNSTMHVLIVSNTIHVLSEKLKIYI